MKLLILIFIFSLNNYAYDLCDYIDIKTCDASATNLGRSTSASFPNSTTAALNNPSSLNMERGFGLESIFFNNETQLGIVTGSGRIGAAISQTPTRETFFSNISFESTQVYRGRRVKQEVYDPDESYAFSFAFNVFGKKQRKGLQFDMGIIAKHNGNKDQSIVGAGATLSFNKVIGIGYAKYKDVYYEDLREKTIKTYNTDGEESGTITYPNTDAAITDIGLDVETLILTLKFGNFAFDHLTIKTTYDDENIDPSYVKILNTSMFYKKWIFTYGLREEESFREDYSDEKFKTEKFKHDGFLGIQYALNKSFMLGLFSNYYLLNEWTMGVVIFI